MKIAIPLADGRLAMHFGHCQSFALVEVNPETRELLGTRELPAPPHQPGLLPRWLAAQGANVIIAGGMGQRALALFMEQGIEVVVGAPALPPDVIVEYWLAGELEAGANVCDH